MVGGQAVMLEINSPCSDAPDGRIFQDPSAGLRCLKEERLHLHPLV